MDVAIRAVNWIFSYGFFSNSPSLSPEFLVTLYRSLLAHGWHVFHNLDQCNGDIQANNHYIAELVGLIWMGLTLPTAEDAKQWLDFALPELWKELMRQTLEDGVSFEASIPYHRLVTEMALFTIWLCIAKDIEVPEEVLQRLRGMLAFLQAVILPDGKFPILGDQDDGRLLKLAVYPDPSFEHCDARGLISVGAEIFDDTGLRDHSIAGRQEVFWLLGMDAASMTPIEEEDLIKPSINFPIAQIFVMRGEGSYVLVDSGTNGQSGVGGHAHNDLFSFELFTFDQGWIIDPGSGVFSSDYHMRNSYRASSSHNVVVIDNEELHPFSERELFTLRDTGEIRIHQWEREPGFTRLKVEHTCYHRMPDPVTTCREYVLYSRPFRFRVKDQFLAKGLHRYSSYLHLAEGVSATCASPSLIILEGKFHRKMSVTLKDYPSKQTPHNRILSGNVSPSYGVSRESSILCISWEASGNSSLTLEFAAEGTASGR
jgi:hypothetical protein